MMDHYGQFPKEVRDRLHIIIVDDGSQRIDALSTLRKEYGAIPQSPRLDLWRIEVDIPWNQPEANNLAVRECVTRWFVRFDIDHWLTLTNMIELLKFVDGGPKEAVYPFSRTCAGPVLKGIGRRNLRPHPNIFLCTRDLWNKVGGSDETLSGNYGHDDFAGGRLLRYGQSPLKICIENFEEGTDCLPRDPSINRKKRKERGRNLKFVHSDKYVHLVSSQV